MKAASDIVWTQETFFPWAEVQDLPYEFDGNRPVAMPIETAGHSRISRNVLTALNARLRDGPCEVLGFNSGVETTGKAVRYPDALVTCSMPEHSARLVPGVVVVFEVASPESSHTDWLVKVREYAAVPSIRRYVILDTTGIALMSMERLPPGPRWRSWPLFEGDILRLPEIGIEIPVAEFYDGMTFPDEVDDAGRPIRRSVRDTVGREGA